METDNTPKETSSRNCFWGFIWLLCVLGETCLWSVLMNFRIVGHTHDKLDRFFSRLKKALFDHDYFTVAEMLNVLITGLKSFNVSSSHLSRRW